MLVSASVEDERSHRRPVPYPLAVRVCARDDAILAAERVLEIAPGDRVVVHLDAHQQRPAADDAAGASPDCDLAVLARLRPFVPLIVAGVSEQVAGWTQHGAGIRGDVVAWGFRRYESPLRLCNKLEQVDTIDEESHGAEWPCTRVDHEDVLLVHAP